MKIYLQATNYRGRFTVKKAQAFSSMEGIILDQFGTLEKALNATKKGYFWIPTVYEIQVDGKPGARLIKTKEFKKEIYDLAAKGV